MAKKDPMDVKHQKIQKFLGKLDSEANGSAALRKLVNEEDESIKHEFDMHDAMGYKLFWDDFYSLGLHIGEREEQALDSVCCCSCC